MKEWYSDLVGKKVSWTNVCGERCLAIVTGFNYHIGFTIQAAEDYEFGKKGDYLTCYRGPMSPTKGGKASYNLAHRKFMTYAANAVRNGHYDVSDVAVQLCVLKKRPKNTHVSACIPSAETCAFAQ